ncbi:hypothetical protein Q7A53_14970 [Halobacillus rhizosphaerae]|uniref:hypothetical protein n=1 Tax=Halobacillus rhizosphaerae TaxID=3064889 RepID=UPI00398ABD2A
MPYLTAVLLTLTFIALISGIMNQKRRSTFLYVSGTLIVLSFFAVLPAVSRVFIKNEETPADAPVDNQTPEQALKVTPEEAKHYVESRMTGFSCSYSASMDKEIDGEPYYRFTCSQANMDPITLYVHKHLKKIYDPIGGKNKTEIQPE